MYGMFNPGEVVVIDRNGMRSSIRDNTSDRRAMCIFEHIYFARPDSVLDGTLVYSARRGDGRPTGPRAPG